MLDVLSIVASEYAVWCHDLPQGPPRESPRGCLRKADSRLRRGCLACTDPSSVGSPTARPSAVTLRIAVLNANTDRSAFAQRWPDDAQKVMECLRPLRPAWRFRAWQARDGELPPDDADDAWLITGSVASVNDQEPWMRLLEGRLLQRHRQRRATVGLCFGHQLIAKALGGRVGPSPGGWRIGTAPTVYAETQRWMRPPQAVIQLSAAHFEQVLQAPTEASVIGGDDFAPVGAMQIGHHMMTTQYHPELTADFMRSLLDEYAQEWDAALVAQAREQLTQPLDAALFMGWVAQFIEQVQELSA